jgi:hypothetical protein
MKLMQVVASGSGFRDLDHNSVRLEALDRLLGVAREKSAALVMLPGGYLTIGSTRELYATIADATQRSHAAGVSLAVGIDLPETTRGKRARAPQLPYYAIVCGSAVGGPWRQTNSTRANAADVDDAEVPGANRIVTIAGRRVGILICGELFSWWARESFKRQNLNLVLDLGHFSMGTGVTKAMENIARGGRCAVAHTHHVAPRSNGSLHFVRADGERKSVPIADSDWFGDEDAFWVAWRFREV